MHELSLIQSVLDITEEHAAQQHFQRILSLKLSFGRLSSVEPAALRFAFEVQSKGTKAEGAKLELDILPVVIYCFSCGKNVEIDGYRASCPVCACDNVALVAGTEELKFLEMEVE